MAKITCEYCGQNNGEDALNCRKCGAPLPDMVCENTFFNGVVDTIIVDTSAFYRGENNNFIYVNGDTT